MTPVINIARIGAVALAVAVPTVLTSSWVGSAKERVNEERNPTPSASRAV